MFLKPELIVFGQVFFAFLLGGIIGYEREYHNSPAGVRTYAAVCLGSCLFGIASAHPYGVMIQSGFEPTRIAAQVASGIGFLCAGVIFKEGMNTVGLTTAATLWVTSAIGIVIAFGMYELAVLSTLFLVVLLALPTIPGLSAISVRRRRLKRQRKEMEEKALAVNGQANGIVQANGNSQPNSIFPQTNGIEQLNGNNQENTHLQ